jgi:cell division protein FtsB
MTGSASVAKFAAGRQQRPEIKGRQKEIDKLKRELKVAKREITQLKSRIFFRARYNAMKMGTWRVCHD